MLRRSLVSLALLLVALSLALPVQAAGMTGNTVTKQKVAGPYKLVLQIGPAESMTMMSGPKAMCAMKGGMEMRPAAKMSACNHHVELQVYNRKTGAVLHGLHVTIQCKNSKGTIMTVPIDTMGTGKNYHYGNNMYMAPGKYTDYVQVNATKTTFSITLM